MVQAQAAAVKSKHCSKALYPSVRIHPGGRKEGIRRSAQRKVDRSVMFQEVNKIKNAASSIRTPMAKYPGYAKKIHRMI